MKVFEDYELKKHTTFKIGGKARKVCFPENVEEFCELLKTIKSPIVLGNCSNVLVSSQGSSEIPDEVLTRAVREVFDMRPYFITKRLDLKRPIYSKTSCYGHFGRELPEFSWEKTDAVADLRTAAKV